MRFTSLNPRFSETEPDDVARAVSEALERHVVVHVSPDAPLEDPLPYWENVIEKIGSFKAVGEDSATGARLEEKSIWMDVRYDPRYHTSFRHFNSAQPLHTDGAYEEEYPATAFFYCAKQAPSGGATLFLDAEDLVKALKSEMPALYEELISTDVHFSKLGGAGKTCRIVDFDEYGPRVNWNYYRVSQEQPDAVRDLAERFHQVLASRFVEQNDVLPLRLAQNDSVFFQDTRVLHGRHAYQAEEAGDRLIWKCYFALSGVTTDSHAAA